MIPHKIAKHRRILPKSIAHDKIISHIVFSISQVALLSLEKLSPRYTHTQTAIVIHI